MAHDPLGDLLERLLLLQRAGNSISAEAREVIRLLFERIEADLARFDPTGVRPRYRAGRRDKLLRSIEERLREFSPELEKLLKDRLAVVGRHQADTARTTLVATLGEVGDRVTSTTPVTQARMRAILNAEPFRGRVLKDHAQRMSANTLDRLGVQLRLGMSAEEGIPDIVRRFRRVKSTTYREAEATVRTAVNFVSNEGMVETYRANAEVVSGLRVVAAIDDRTTALCLSLDGNILAFDDPYRPPYHWVCRTVIVPEIRWDDLDVDPPPEPERIVRDMDTVDDKDLDRKVSARRRTGDFGDVKRIPSSRVASQWFRDQRVAVQNKMVGPARAKLFREGKIDLKDLVTKDGRMIPLDDLLRN